MAFLLPALAGGAASAVGGAIGNNLASAFGLNNNGNSSASSSNSSGSPSSDNPDLSAEQVHQYLVKHNLKLSADDEASLQNQKAQDAYNMQMRSQLDAQRQQAPLYNDIANTNAERNLVLNAQKYAADNTANQLNNLQQARNTAQVGISNALNTTASMFK